MRSTPLLYGQMHDVFSDPERPECFRDKETSSAAGEHPRTRSVKNQACPQTLEEHADELEPSRNRRYRPDTSSAVEHISFGLDKMRRKDLMVERRVMIKLQLLPMDVFDHTIALINDLIDIVFNRPSHTTWATPAERHFFPGRNIVRDDPNKFAFRKITETREKPQMTSALAICIGRASHDRMKLIDFRSRRRIDSCASFLFVTDCNDRERARPIEG